MSDTEKNIRAFLAIEPPEEILAAVGRLQEKLKRELTGKISWTRPHGNHLTLKFFGDISQNDVASICEAVRRRATAAAPLMLAIKKMGVFPDARKPRVLWLGTEGDVENLSLLQKQLETDFAQIGFPQETRPFRAHLTLARIKIPGSVKGITEALDKYKDFSAGEFTATELVLFQSQLTPQGAIYTKLATIPLRG